MFFRDRLRNRTYSARRRPRNTLLGYAISIATVVGVALLLYSMTRTPENEIRSLIRRHFESVERKDLDDYKSTLARSCAEYEANVRAAELAFETSQTISDYRVSSIEVGENRSRVVIRQTVDGIESSYVSILVKEDGNWKICRRG